MDTVVVDARDLDHSPEADLGVIRSDPVVPDHHILVLGLGGEVEVGVNLRKGQGLILPTRVTVGVGVGAGQDQLVVVKEV